MAKAAKRTGRSETRQVAALPWRRGEAGLEILMITSRETRRWVIPKGSGDLRRHVVAVYPMEGVLQLGDWPEAHQRDRRWMTPEAAADSVHEADLALLIRDFAATPPSD